MHFQSKDYSSFGMPMPGRQYTSGTGYRWGFQGQEKVDEISGSEDHIDFKFRGYNPRTGRFWSVDPLSRDYPWNSSYAFSENRVIDGIDLEGKEFYSVHIIEGPDGHRTKVEVINFTNVQQDGMTNVSTAHGYGPLGDVGVNYVITRVDENGNWVNRSEFNVKNMYGVYNGPNNPKKYWEKPGPDGYEDDYSLSPINETDLNGMIHDKDFDFIGLKGISGVMSDESTPANQAYRERAAKIVDKFNKHENDAITGKPVTEEAAKAANKYAEKGITSFKFAEKVKAFRKSHKEITERTGGVGL